MLTERRARAGYVQFMQTPLARRMAFLMMAASVPLAPAMACSTSEEATELATAAPARSISLEPASFASDERAADEPTHPAAPPTRARAWATIAPTEQLADVAVEPLEELGGNLVTLVTQER